MSEVLQRIDIQTAEMQPTTSQPLNGELNVGVEVNISTPNLIGEAKKSPYPYIPEPKQEVTDWKPEVSEVKDYTGLSYKIPNMK